MRLALFYTLFLLFLAFGVFSLFQAVAMSSIDTQAEEEQLSLLSDELEELRTEYLRIVFSNIAPEAEKSGFVSVSAPRYVLSGSAVAQR